MVFLFMMIILPYNPVFDLFGAVVFGSCLFFGVRFFDFSVEVDDNRSNQRNHDDPVYSEYDGHGASQICDRGDITETDRCHQCETVPQRILIGGDSLFHKRQDPGGGEDQHQQPEQDFRGIGFAYDILKQVQPDV